MGKKSDKKIKSDRINALRKQYDSFIEEDKKRKERNDYILQRLDKMCYSTSGPLQLRPKTVYSEYIQPYNRFDYRPDKMKLHGDVFPRTNHHIAEPTLQLDIPRHFDDISVLREISKKYILIPKSQTINNYLATNPLPQENKPVQPEPQSNVMDNNDWRSKYNILEQLKKKENEQNINKPEEEKIPPKTQFYRLESEPLSKINDNGIQNIKYDDDTLAKYEAEIPEKDLPDDSFKENELRTMEGLKISDKVQEELVTNIAEPSIVIEANIKYTPVMEEPVAAVAESHFYKNPGIETTLNVGNDVVDTHYTNNNTPVTEDVPYQPQQEQINILYEEKTAQEQQIDTTNYQTNVYQDYPSEYEQHEPVVEPTQYQENEFKTVENEYSSTPVANQSQKIQEPNTAPEVDVNTGEDNIEYPIDIINVPDFTPADNVELHDGVNINPEYNATKPEVNLKRNEEELTPINEPNINEQHVDNSGVEAFNAEQRDMVYNYDQEGSGEPYDPEYIPDQGYPQHSDYDYYGNEQPDAYPVQVNEYEETTERYDRNYDQQFVTNYDGFDPTTVQQEEQQPTEEVQQPVLYQQTEQDYEQYNYEQNTQNTTEEVMQELDREYGYVEPDPEVLQVATDK